MPRQFGRSACGAGAHGTTFATYANVTVRQRGAHVCVALVVVLSQVSVLVTCVGCSRDGPDAGSTTVRVEPAPDPTVVHVAHPEGFSVVHVETRTTPNELHMNGVVAPDITRTVHVTSLPGGKLVERSVNEPRS